MRPLIRTGYVVYVTGYRTRFMNVILQRILRLQSTCQVLGGSARPLHPPSRRLPVAAFFFGCCFFRSCRSPLPPAVMTDFIGAGALLRSRGRPPAPPLDAAAAEALAMARLADVFLLPSLCMHAHMRVSNEDATQDCVKMAVSSLPGTTVLYKAPACHSPHPTTHTTAWIMESPPGYN